MCDAALKMVGENGNAVPPRVKGGWVIHGKPCQSYCGITLRERCFCALRA